LAVISSILAWLNTEKISRDLKDIKANLGINEEKKPSFLIMTLIGTNSIPENKAFLTKTFNFSTYNV